MKKTIRKAFKFRLTPNSNQVQKMVEFAGAHRFVWNKSLAKNLALLAQKQPILGYQEANFWLGVWKKSNEYGFLKQAHSQSLQQTLKQLENAFKDGFDKNQPTQRLPQFKRKGQKDTFSYPQGFKLDANRVFLPKIGWVKYRHARQVIGNLKNCTVSRRGKQGYVSIQVEYEAQILRHESTSMVGIDLGVKRFATLSEGSYIEPLNSFKKLAKKLALAQKRLSKKVKFSANWKRQKQTITSIHERIANARHDFLHKASTPICKNHAMIVIEDLKVKNMSRAVKGNAEHPGKNVKAKSGLNQFLLDQGWGMFVQMLEYKPSWLGGEVLKVVPKYTSQTCPCCGHVSKENRKIQAHFECMECGFKTHADDWVGALNVLERGHRL
jgi:putative transposase